MSEDVQKRAVKTNHLLVTMGSLTEQGGQVIAANSVTIDGVPLAVVGGAMSCEDGNTAIIVDGTGFGATLYETPFALVDSRLDNGAGIINTLQTKNCRLVDYHGKPIERLLDPAYVPRAREQVT